MSAADWVYNRCYLEHVDLQLWIPKASLLSVHALMTGAGEAYLSCFDAGVISGDGPSIGNSYALAWDYPLPRNRSLICEGCQCNVISCKLKEDAQNLES